MPNTPIAATSRTAITSPVRDVVGAGAAVDVHVPCRPDTLHCSRGPSHGVSQHTPSTQKRPVVQPLGCVAHERPCGIDVLVGSGVGVSVAVAVGVFVVVAVGVLLAVGVTVGVSVTVAVGVSVGV